MASNSTRVLFCTPWEAICKRKKFALQRALEGNKNSSFLAFVMLNDVLFLDCLYNIVSFALSTEPTQIYLVCAMALSFY